MPHSTMHLWLARKVAENLKFEPGARYYLGSIAPDAVGAGHGTTKKEVSHLREPDFNSGYENAKKILEQFYDNEFLRGCAIHIMFDDLWLKGPYLHLLKSFNDKVPKEKIKAQYQKDCEYLELWLFRQNDSRPVWSAVMSSTLERYFDILTPGEIDDWRKNSYMQLNQKKITTMQTKFITLDVMRTFLDKAANKIADEIREINTKDN